MSHGSQSSPLDYSGRSSLVVNQKIRKWQLFQLFGDFEGVPFGDIWLKRHDVGTSQTRKHSDLVAEDMNHSSIRWLEIRMFGIT